MAQGPVIEECHDSAGKRISHAWTDRYGVLFDTDRWSTFVSEMPESATTAFIVTDSSTTFAQIAGELPGHLDTVRLYERYLTTFAINTGASMKYELLDYQREAAIGCLKRLRAGP